MNHFRSAHPYGACLGLLAASFLCACTVGPDFIRPPPPDSDRYSREQPLTTTVAADGQAQHFVPGAALAADWWRLFKSEPLDAVVKQAIANNPTLQAAEASLRQSQDNLRAGEGVFYPQVGIGAGASRMRSAPIQQGSTAPGTIFNVVTVSGTVGYGIDVFGGERRAVEGLQAQTDYQRNLNRAAYLTLTANVVNAAIARAAYSAQVLATERMIEMEKTQLQATEAQYRAGTAPYSNVLGVRSLIAANQASLAPLRQKISQAENLLATLEGVEPSKVILPEIELSRLALPDDLPLSLPSELVRQRPDILSAEAQLHVASADIGVATAAMFPSFNLSATYGSGGSGLGNLSAAGGRFWSFGPSLALPLFQGGRLSSARQAAIDAFEQSQAVYRQTALSAFAQVADTLKALEHDAETLQAQSEAKQVAAEALKLVQASYRSGMIAYLDVLAADVQFHQASIAYLQAVAQRHQDTVALFVALGGGWWNAQRSTDEITTQ
jgi:NodT family efflux transporter outer membrane factor (OMF) lipoprotein